MDLVRRRELRRVLHHDVITAILACIDDDEELKFAFEYVKELIENELKYFNKSEE